MQTDMTQSTPTPSKNAALSSSVSATSILLIDDEPSILQALHRVFRGKNYRVTTALGGQEGIDKLNSQQYEVIISDMRMPEIDGAQVLSVAAELYPSCSRILLTGYSDQESTVKAINSGKIDAYIEKPWDNIEIKATVDRLIIERKLSIEKEVRLGKKNKDLFEFAKNLKRENEESQEQLRKTTTLLDLANEELKQTFETSIAIFSRLINMRLDQSPEMLGYIVDDCKNLARQLNLDDNIVDEIGRAAMLFQIGTIAFSDNQIEEGLNISNDASIVQWREHAITGSEALKPLEALEFTALIIRHQFENIDGSGFPDKLEGKDIPLGARILRIVADFHQMRQKAPAKKTDFAQSQLKKFSNRYYDDHLVKEFLKLREKTAGDLKPIHVTKLASELEPGDVNARDILNREGMLLLAKETVFNSNIIQRLNAYEADHQLELNIWLKVNT